MNEYNDIQRVHKTKMRTMLGRQLKIAKPDASEDEVNKFLEDGEQNPFSFSATNTMEMKKALEDVNMRHKELKKLEESMKELHSLFVDMAAMVEQQGPLIDQIEFNVESAEQHIVKVVKELSQAGDYQRKARRKKVCLIVFFTVLIGAILLFIAIYFGLFPDNGDGDKTPPAQTPPGTGVTTPPVVTQPETTGTTNDGSGAVARLTTGSK